MCPRDPTWTALRWLGAAALAVGAVGALGLELRVLAHLVSATVTGSTLDSDLWGRVWQWPSRRFWLRYLLGVAACLLLTVRWVLAGARGQRVLPLERTPAPAAPTGPTTRK